MARITADRMLRSKMLSGLPTTPGETLVLLCLRSHANADDIAFPARRTIAEETGMQRSGVDKAVHSLIAKGIIQELSPGSQGSGNSARYLVRFEAELWPTG
ncbi:helix-turn-helix domain-containing protein [Microbacterium sp. EST19A]|uniref:helix-turn-helix domain-containing protein n=1 Tax=Microbacterium sp. EST19A TaxID=2862681 RepID=UPI001CBFC256|nr:helix-turn-helix domain-containing protein [Microbacterium sp. EST19A]